MLQCRKQKPVKKFIYSFIAGFKVLLSQKVASLQVLLLDFRGTFGIIILFNNPRRLLQVFAFDIIFFFGFFLIDKLLILYNIKLSQTFDIIFHCFYLPLAQCFQSNGYLSQAVLVQYVFICLSMASETTVYYHYK